MDTERHKTMTHYEAHNHPDIVDAVTEAHALMVEYAEADVEEQGESLRDVIRRISKLNESLSYTTKHN